MVEGQPRMLGGAKSKERLEFCYREGQKCMHSVPGFAPGSFGSLSLGTWEWEFIHGERNHTGCMHMSQSHWI